MATKKVIKKEEDKKEEAVEQERYFYAVGRRKTAIAKIKLFPSKAVHNSFKVNEKKSEEYFSVGRFDDVAKSPLAFAGAEAKFDVIVSVRGGGVSAQADAVKLGVARSLVLFDETLKKALKGEGFLTRDPREVERKKPGLKKARRAPQWAKR